MRFMIICVFLQGNQMVPVSNARKDVHDREEQLPHKPTGVDNNGGRMIIAVVVMIRELEEKRHDRVRDNNTA